MFQLIVAVISIALVAALALASIFYGGEAFTRSQLKAQVTTMINQAQQLSGAQTLYKTDKGGLVAATPAELQSEGYLASVPVPPSKITDGAAWTLNNAAKAAYVDLIDDDNTVAEIAKIVNDQGTGGVDQTSGAAKFYFAL